MAEENVTPAQLREDVDWFRAAVVYFAQLEGPASLDTPRLHRAAAALERWAEALERGERVCRWAGWTDWLGCTWYRASCYPEPLRATLFRYCSHCGGRVVLGEKEASDA